MEEEFEPIRKTEEEIKEEKANKKEEEITKEKDNNVVNEPKASSNDNKKARRIISRILWALFFLFILFEAVMGILNMQKINENKKPIWCFSTSKETTKDKTEETCHLGLYVIVKTKDGNETRTSLKPFFLR